MTQALPQGMPANNEFLRQMIYLSLWGNALLAHDSGLSIRLNVKPHPCYVSDVIPADIHRALHWLKTDAPAWARQAGERLERAQQTGRMQVATHFYWASPSPAWEAPLDLWADLSRSACLISKGDVNYRRWLGDARWSSSTSLQEIIDPPTSLLLLRVSKSDVAAGLAPERANELFRRDPDWRLNGHWGMIQFVKSKKGF